MPKTQAPVKPETGTPRWTAITGAVVGIGLLFLGVVNYVFPPKPAGEPGPKLAASAVATSVAPSASSNAAAAFPPVPAVSVSGSGNVGVVQMTGGQFHMGGATAAAAAPSAAPGSAP